MDYLNLNLTTCLHYVIYDNKHVLFTFYFKGRYNEKNLHGARNNYSNSWEIKIITKFHFSEFK